MFTNAALPFFGSCKRASLVAVDNVLAGPLQYACTFAGNAKRRIGLWHRIPDTFKECAKIADIWRVNLQAIIVHLMLWAAYLANID